MFTLSKTRPEFTYKPDAHKELGSRLNHLGGRVLLICSMNPSDRVSILQVKRQLTDSNVTFIQADQSESFIDIDKLDQLIDRAEVFHVSSVVSIGGLCQRMSGKYVSQKLELSYIELPTTLSLTKLLIPQTVYANRVKNDFIVQEINSDNMKSILIDPTLIREYQPIDLTLEGIAILFNLAQLFLNDANNKVAKTESLNLYKRLLTEIEEDHIDRETLLYYSLTAAFYEGASSNINMDFTLYSIIAGYRYGFNAKTASVKLLPYLLDEAKEEAQAIKIRELIHDKGITSRLSDLGFTLEQLKEISKARHHITAMIEKAF